MYKKGLVSIIIPCFNGTEFLTEAINSVLNQTYTNFEIIVVNDGSNEPQDIDFFKNYSNPKVKIISTENFGPPIARNTGIQNSTGEFFLPLDADDMIDPKFLEETVKEMQKDPKIGVVYTDQKHFGTENKIVKMREFDFKELLVANHVSVCSLVRREAFEELKAKNGFGYVPNSNPEIKAAYEDWDLWIGIAELGWKFSHISQPLFFYRKHGESNFSRSRKIHTELIKQLMKTHKESYQKYYEYVIEKLHELEINKDAIIEDISDQSKNPIWLLKRFLKSITGKL